MTQLSNANLLDENVSNNLKSERLQKTAQVAQNPNMEQGNGNNMNNADGGQQMQMPPQMQQQMQMPPQMQQPINDPTKNYQNTGRIERNNNATDNNSDDNFSHNLPNKNYGGNGKSKEKSDDGKILGMPKGLAIGLGLVALAVGGYLLYKKFGKGGKGKTSSSSSDVASATASTATASSSTVGESIKSLDLTP